MKGRRITVLAALAATLAVTLVLAIVPSVLAEATQIRTPLSFILTPTRCPNLQVTVEGSGDSFIVTNERIDKNGIHHIIMNNLVTGSATDSDGANYGFNYHNHASFEIPPSGFPFQVALTDHFNLNGQGKANHLHVGFVARLTFTGPSDPPIVEVVNERGNPMGCDGI